MERLTERFDNGQAGVAGCGNNCKYDYQYCDNGKENCPTMSEIYEKLAAYEEAEEQGLLIRLLLSMGSTVYLIVRGEILEDKITCISIHGEEKEVIMRTPLFYFGKWQFNKTVFLTRKEAEEALKHGGSEKNEDGR